MTQIKISRLSDLAQIVDEPDEPESKTIVRITTEWYGNHYGLFGRKKIRFLKRMCKGFNQFEDDIYVAGPELAAESITNLHDVLDGVYELVLCPERDWESGVIDDWHYVLTRLDMCNKEGL